MSAPKSQALPGAPMGQTGQGVEEDFDLDAFLGVVIEPGRKAKGRAPVSVECGQTPPKASPERWNNFHTFVFGGYIARVIRTTCTTCDSLQDTLEGLFIEEVHTSTEGGKTRRLTAMAKNGDWPTGGGHRKEVVEVEVDLCGGCVGELGFDKEVNAKGLPFTLVPGRGRL